MADEDKNKLEEVNEALYSRGTDAIFAKRRHGLKEEALPPKLGSEWKEEGEPVKKTTIPYSKIFLGALIFFFLALGVTLIKFFVGSNTVSGGNIDILLTGPVSISSGETLPLNVEVKNNNPVALQVVDLQIEFPTGTKSPDNLSQDLTRYAEILGDINPGQSATRLIKSVLYGPENTQEVVKVSVEYRLSGSNAIFSKEKDYTVLISSSPVNISVVGPSEVNANQSASFAINVTSNSLSTIKNLILKIDYPFGFNLTSSSLKPISANQDVFALGDMAPGSQVNLRISGIFQGQSGEERVLTFNVGNPSPNDNKTISTPFAIFSQSVSLNNPSVGLTTLINQDSSSVVSVSPGNKIETDISWQNNLAENIYNMAIKVSLVGAMLDKTSVFANNGFYNSADNSVTFDKSTISDFDTVAPGAQGGVNFSWASLVPSPGASDQFNNSSVILNITATGMKNGDATPEVLFSDSRTVKISSGLNLLSRGYRTFGPFQNSGPFPPKVDQESTYTITWTVTDSFNDVNGVQVTATLPPNVRWTGNTSPATENVTYDNASGRVTWNVGNIRADTGSIYSSRIASFQVAATPSISQVGQPLTLLNEATVSGTDTYSGARIGETKPAATTNITSDPQYTEGVGNVVQ